MRQVERVAILAEDLGFSKKIPKGNWFLSVPRADQKVTGIFYVIPMANQKANIVLSSQGQLTRGQARLLSLSYGPHLLFELGVSKLHPFRSRIPASII